ncbi:MAG TPA: acyl-CoA dehydrogenase family protein [Candidatus Scatomorpha merdavium]|jgi:alkylation response protein AidB-like acyl-CoA dehydrogenase|nr:acyl-CoA dehydrogenase family protein [Oscillospiraceae bacterium]HIS16587.1 acyl-CoA dehydrogenase family protein [Candidatus Scatomorpha merdavium]
MILSENHLMIREMARQFAEKELTREVLDEAEATNSFRKSVLDHMVQAGLTSIKIPEEYGGQGGDNLSFVIALEEVCRKSAVAGIYMSNPNSLGSGPLLINGTEEQKRYYIPKLATLEKRMCFALSEPGAGSDAGSIITRAVRDGDSYVISGSKCFISGATIADYAVVFAKTDPEQGVRGISAFIVDLKLPGVILGKPERKMGLIGYPIGDIVLEDVRVPAENMLGEENRGFTNAMKTLDGGRLGVAATALGVAQGCLDEAVKFAKERKQFGRPIAKFQAISFMLAEMATKIAAARELVYAAAAKKDAGEPDSAVYASMAKFFTAEACNEIAGKALQIHGGYGYVKDYDIERKYRDCRVFTIFEGSSQVQQMVISRQLLK